MRRSCRRFAALLTLVSLFVMLLAQPAMAVFLDVPDSSWYTEAVHYTDQHGLFQGTSKTAFSPNKTMTRGMFVTVLYRLDRETETNFPAGEFTDVPNGWYYTVPIRWAVASGIAEGRQPEAFCPEEPVTRLELSEMIVGYARHLSFTLPETVGAVEFTDTEALDEEALSYITACQKAGLLRGYEDGTVRPGNTATRAEVSTIVYRLGTMLERAGYPVGPGKEKDWRLILVNRWNKMPDGYTDTITLKDAGNGQKIDARAYDDMQAMFSAMRADGLSPYVTSGFRTNATQQFLFNRKILQYQAYGYSYNRAWELAQQWVAVPGTSEHELGLALDISMNAYSCQAVYNWLAAHAWEYGFIYRYQADKMEYTGINPEPWHYRYVGRDNAEAIYLSGLCLEEYVEKEYS